MDIFYQVKGLKLITQMLSAGKSVEPVIPYCPQKPNYTSDFPTARAFPRVSPEKVGISSGRVSEFLLALSAASDLNLHGITLYRQGKVFCECDFGLYKSDIWHTTYSMCKTVTSLAIGMLIDEGKLKGETTLGELFDIGVINRISKSKITVNNLLTMSSGVGFNELGAVTETDWEKAFLESTQKDTAGEKFEYNSMNTYMLARIVEKVSGQSLTDYLTPRLWQPLGIDLHPWECCPKGYEKGGWGLYLRREDALKLGVLILNGGVWKRKRVISEKFVRFMLHRHKICPEEYGGYDYGCQIWVGKREKSFLLNGMFGQNVLGFFDTGVVIAVNGGNNEVFQQSSFFKIATEYFATGDFSRPLPENKGGYKRLLQTAEGMYAEKRKFFGSGKALQASVEKIAARDGEYEITGNNTHSASLLPFVLRGVQNNHVNGVEKIVLHTHGDVLDIDFVSDTASRRVSAGIKNGVYTQVDFGGEKYTVGAFARVGENEDGVTVITVNTAFCETASERVIKLYFYPDHMRVCIKESPGAELFDNAFATLIPKGKIINTLTEKADIDYLKYKINCAFNPEYVCVKIG